MATIKGFGQIVTYKGQPARVVERLSRGPHGKTVIKNMVTGTTQTVLTSDITLPDLMRQGKDGRHA